MIMKNKMNILFLGGFMNSIKYLLLLIVTATVSATMADVDIKLNRSTAGVTLTNDAAQAFFDFLPYEAKEVYNCIKKSRGSTNQAPVCIEFGDQVIGSVKSGKGIKCEIDFTKDAETCQLNTEHGQIANLIAGEPAVVNLGDKLEFGTGLGNNLNFSFGDTFKFYCDPQQAYNCFMQSTIGASGVRVSSQNPNYSFDGDQIEKNRHTVNAYSSSGLQTRAEALFDALKESLQDRRPKFDGNDPVLFSQYHEGLGYTISFYNLSGSIVSTGKQGQEGFIQVELDSSTVSDFVGSIKPGMLDVLKSGNSIFGIILRDNYKIEFTDNLASATLTLYY